MLKLVSCRGVCRTDSAIQMREHTECNIFKALIMVYCRLTSISLPPGSVQI